MQPIIEFIQQNIHFAPALIFLLLLLAGLNLPVSEDGMLFLSALLAKQNPEMTAIFFLAVYLGAYFSDLICFGLGHFLGNRLWKIRFFARMIPKEKIDKVSQFYKKYGVFTLILGRFIPFGVRNALFLTAGLGKMNFLRFSLADLTACTLSSIFYFTLYYHYGENVIEFIKKGNIIIFSVAASLALIFIVLNKCSRFKILTKSSKRL